ncbi:MAG TPA: alpha/beta hydrolase [Gammaproteobacteria bacterium]|nr:alpha/beta hydrolase [Gammaproteobacteria bacterium]
MPFFCLGRNMKIQQGRVSIKEGIVIGEGGGRSLKADIFLPPLEEKNRPAVLFIHGGGWIEGDRSQLRGYGILLARLGFVCMCNSYRLSNESIWPAQIQDVNCAIRYLRANATDLGLDPERIGVSGNSAGGHLSLMAAATNYDQIFEGEGGSNEVSSEIKAVCAIYPPTTIRQLEMLNPLENAFLMLMGKEAKKEDFDKASPLNYVTEDYPPCMLIHGSTDSVVRLKDSTKFYEKLIEFNRPASLHIFSEEEHAFDGEPDYGRAIADLQALFFKKYL